MIFMISLKLTDWTWHFMIKYMKMAEELDKRSDMVLLETILKTTEELGDTDMKVGLSEMNSPTITAIFYRIYSITHPRYEWINN